MNLWDRWVIGELGRPLASNFEQPHKQERRHTLIQNLKVGEASVDQIISHQYQQLLKTILHQ
ncbi:hypothetical protein MTR_5g069670 [Medicago truncatula]|uniref:Uncharacterized protein n=1 Tax=Medicago truncatula TaxID=3880 RepID=G7KE41_MEDTR|nr:hypothetical protein MTR_5g069670 [Medicago truncatula]